jgi:hypothetical protein
MVGTNAHHFCFMQCICLLLETSQFLHLLRLFRLPQSKTAATGVVAGVA